MFPPVLAVAPQPSEQAGVGISSFLTFAKLPERKIDDYACSRARDMIYRWVCRVMFRALI